MNTHRLYRLTLIFTLLCLSSLAHAAPAPEVLAQIQACRATSSLLVLRGEGFPAKHEQRFERDLSALNESMQAPALSADEELQKHYQTLASLLRQGRDFGPDDEHVPWSYAKDLNHALNVFLSRADALTSEDKADHLALQLEYLGVQYLSRAYIGDYEIPRELTHSYLGQDESKLTPVIQQGFEQRVAQQAPLQAKQTLGRWLYLKNALEDLNSQAASSSSRSGRPFVPMIVDRQTRLLSESLLSPTEL